VLTARAQAPVPPTPDPAAPVYVVGYIDVVTAAKAPAMTLLKQFRSSCAKENGNQRCEIVQRMEQQNEFAILEIWKDQTALKAHAAGPGAQLRERLKTMLASPYDERVHTGLSVMPPHAAPGGRIVYAITHIDVVPVAQFFDKAPPLLTAFAEASRKVAGNGRMEVLQQVERRSNHFTLVEIWSNKRQLEAHQALPRTVQFREQLQPLIGALYDERLYKILD
jgi:quinol monooxygenase YgiN